MHVRTCSLNDPPHLQSLLRPKIALLLGLSLRLFLFVRKPSIFAFTLKRRLLLLWLRIFITFRATPHHTIVKRFPSFVHIRITVMTGPASPCMHNLVTWILFYTPPRMTVTTCTRTRVANVNRAPLRCTGQSDSEIYRPRKFSLSIHTTHATPQRSSHDHRLWG